MDEKTKIQIYHDAFLQHGGAEKVALSWAEYLDCSIVTLAKKDDFSWTGNKDIFEKAPYIKNHRMLQLFFPAIPLILKIMKFDEDHLRLVSTTGLAHYFGGRWNKRIIYMHSPSRWIWNQNEIKRDLSSITKFIMSALRPFFKKYDLSKIRDSDILIANSRATASRILEIYKKEVPVIFPPVTMPKSIPVRPTRVDVNSVFFLAIGRKKSYKGFDEAIEACRLASVKLVLVGEGSSEYQSQNVLGLGFVSVEELVWLYQNAQALIATGSEDFGLTPVEAALHGCPTLAYPRRGYFDSVRNGISGRILTECSIKAMSSAISNFEKSNYSEINLKNYAAEFSINSHMEQLLAYFIDKKIE